MDRTLNRYRFTEAVPMQEAEDSLMLAVLAAEGIYGRSRVRLETSFALDAAKRACVIDASTEVGQHVSRVFTTFITKQFGEEAFRLERLANETKPLSQTIKEVTP